MVVKAAPAVRRISDSESFYCDRCDLALFEVCTCVFADIRIKAGVKEASRRFCHFYDALAADRRLSCILFLCRILLNRDPRSFGKRFDCRRIVKPFRLHNKAEYISAGTATEAVIAFRCRKHSEGR